MGVGLVANIRLHATTWKTLTATNSSRPNPEALVAHEVLAHPYMTFYSCKCGLRGGAAAVAATLIVYDDVEIADRTTTRRR
jgi:hypothetical protein